MRLLGLACFIAVGMFGRVFDRNWFIVWIMVRHSGVRRD
jgi:hypothetical protein